MGKSTENLENVVLLRKVQKIQKTCGKNNTTCLFHNAFIFSVLLFPSHASASVCFVNINTRDWRKVCTLGRFGSYLGLVSPVFILAFLEMVRLGLCRIGHRLCSWQQARARPGLKSSIVNAKKYALWFLITWAVFMDLMGLI